MSSETATVEVLTAEVRVLMVGSRQVTLSVARQLDWVKREDLTAFGRIKLKQDSECLIGSDLVGNLCLAQMASRPGAPYLLLSEDDPKVKSCLSFKSHYSDDLRVDWGGQTVLVAYEDIEWCEHRAHEYQKDQNCGWSVNGHADKFDEAVERRKQRWSMRATDEALPLIVLAGLR